MHGRRDGEISLREKEKYITSLICGISRETMQMNLFTKQKQTHRLRELREPLQGGRIGEGLGKRVVWKF